MASDEPHSQVAPGNSLQDLGEFRPIPDIEDSGCRGVQSTLIADFPDPIEWEDELQSEHHYSPQPICTQPDALWVGEEQTMHSEVRPRPLYVAHHRRTVSSRLEDQPQAAQGWTCELQPQAQVRTDLRLGSLWKGKVSEACEGYRNEEPTQNFVIGKKETSHKHGVLQQTCQRSQASSPLPDVRPSHEGMNAGQVLQQERPVGIMLAKPCPDSSQEASSARLPGRGAHAWSNAPLAPALGPSEAAASPREDVSYAPEDLQFGAEIPVRVGVGAPQVAVTPQQAPSWHPTIPCLAVVPSSTMTTQVRSRPDARLMNPAEALLREMQARVLKAAMPDYYED